MKHETIAQKIRRGWTLTRSAARIFRVHSSLLILPWLSFIAIVAAIVGYLVIGIDFRFHREGPNAAYSTTHISVWSFVWLLVFYVLLGLVQTFIFAMIISSVLRLLSGQKVMLGAVTRVVLRRSKTLTQFSIYNSGVGFALANTIGRLPLVGNALSLLSNTTWAVANVFGIPVIMDTSENLTPTEVSRRSVKVLKEGWGEGATFKLSIWIIGLVTVLGSYAVLTVLAQPLFAWFGHTVVATVCISGFGTLVIIMECLAFVLFSTIAKVALYKYATDGQTSNEFDKDVLRASITVRQARKVFS